MDPKSLGFRAQKVFKKTAFWIVARSSGFPEKALQIFGLFLDPKWIRNHWVFVLRKCSKKLLFGSSPDLPVFRKKRYKFLDSFWIQNGSETIGFPCSESVQKNCFLDRRQIFRFSGKSTTNFWTLFGSKMDPKPLGFRAQKVFKKAAFWIVARSSGFPQKALQIFGVFL